MASTTRTLKLGVFISYASEQYDLAEKLYYALINSGHEVFFDSSSLQPSDDYNNLIVSQIRASDLFVFLISPESIEKGSYALTELEYAKQIWKSPKRHVIPVMAVDTGLDQIPNYLSSVTILYPRGNAVAEVVTAINDRTSGWKPEDTHHNQAKIVSKNTSKLEIITLKQELVQLENQWYEERKQYMSISNSGREVKPTIGRGLFFLFFTLIIATIFSFVAASKLKDPMFDSPLVTAVPLIGVIFGLIGFFYSLHKTRAYKKAYKRFSISKSKLEKKIAVLESN